jgi:RNA polymerase sigma factor (sigma-70 family)
MITTETMPHTVERSDADLVTDSLGGRRDAFRQIVERYQTLVCSLAYSATGNVSQSEDVAQETFISAWKDLRLLREPDKLRAWLCGIVRNKVHRNLREEGREPVRNADPLDDAQESSAAGELPSEQAVNREEEAILWRSLEKIPENYREPLILFYREHKSIEHVAAELELSEDVVRQRLSRGRKLLQEEVQSFVENTLRRTAPGQAFSGAVLSALPLAAGTTAMAGASLGAKGSAAAKSGLLAAWLWPFIGIIAGFAAQWAILGGGPRGRERLTRRFGLIAAWIFVLAFSIGGQQVVRSLGQHRGWNDRTFFSAMAWFFWFYAMVIATWTIAMYRRAQAIRQKSAAEGGSPCPPTTPMKPVTRMLAMLGTNLMLFSCVILLAWGAHDRMTAGITVGIMLALSIWHFILFRGKTGLAAVITYIAQLASSCAVMLAIFNLRFDAWAACRYGVGTAEIHRLLPTRMVPILTLALVVWAGVLLALTRPKPLHPKAAF